MVSADIKANVKQQGKKKTFYKKHLPVIVEVQDEIQDEMK